VEDQLTEVQLTEVQLTEVQLTEVQLTEVQLAELRKKLSVMSVTAVMDAYRSAYFQCKLEGDKVPSARAIQTLVQVWREMRRWSPRK
jgi:hypothetical protein